MVSREKIGDILSFFMEEVIRMILVTGATGQLGSKTRKLLATNIAKAAKSLGVKLLYISTDYAFDGINDGEYSVDAPTNPQKNMAVLN